MKKIISHNTFSCLPVRQWWLRPFAWMARCQDEDDLTQILDCAGFDVRVRFHRDKPVLAHGLAEFDLSGEAADVIHLLSVVNFFILKWPKQKPFYVRVLLETTPFMTRYQRARQKELFWVFCDTLKDKYPNITFYGGWPRDEWRQKVYDFQTQEPDVTEMHGSVSGCKLNCLRLKSWAKKHNREIIEGAKTEYVMLDYVEFR